MPLVMLSRGELSLATIFTVLLRLSALSQVVQFCSIINCVCIGAPMLAPPLLCPGEDDQPVKMLVLAYLPALQCNYILRLL
jgi:hypothetical protein